MKSTQVYCETYDVQRISSNVAIVSFEKQKIEIPLNFEETRDKLIYDALKRLQDRVELLEGELKNQKLLAEIHIEKEVSDASAKTEVVNYLKQQREKGIHQVNIINLVTTLNLPADQIERIMDGLGKTGVVKENGPNSESSH